MAGAACVPAGVAPTACRRDKVNSALFSFVPSCLGTVFIRSLMELFSTGQPLELPMGWHLTVLAGLALAVMPLAVNSALKDASPHALTPLTQPKETA